MWRTTIVTLTALLVAALAFGSRDEYDNLQVAPVIIGSVVLLVLLALAAFWAVPKDWSAAKAKARRREHEQA